MSVNQVNLIGYTGQRPTLRHTEQGTPVSTFSVATNETWQSDGERRERTEWHQITAWGRLGEVVHEHLDKGRLVFVSGRLRTRSWMDSDGAQRVATEVVAGEVKFLGRKPSGESLTYDPSEVPPTTENEIPC